MRVLILYLHVHQHYHCDATLRTVMTVASPLRKICMARWIHLYADKVQQITVHGSILPYSPAAALATLLKSGL